MSGFKVYQDSYIGATIISNRFIDEYMNEANDAQLKVYLYLVRMLNANLETGVMDIADRFNHTEKDVIRALKYWEKKGLLTLEYDEENNLSGVHLVNLCKGEAKGPSVESTHKKVSRKVVSEQIDQEQMISAQVVSAPVIAEVNVHENVSSAPVIAEKITYSAKELQEFGKAQGKQLVFLAETYFARPLSPSDLQSLAYINEQLGLSEDLIDYLLQYCAEKGKRDFRYAEKVAIGWKEKGIETVGQATGGNLKYEKIVYTIMNRLGKQGSPTDKELEYILKWIKEYGFSEDVILDACDRTVMATDSHRFQYAEGILSNWHKQNAHTPDEVRALDSSFKKKNAEGQTSSATKPVSRKSTVSGNFGNFAQNDIDFDALSRKIFVN